MEEIQKKKCQYCGKECKNVGSHERFCKMNPEIRKANINHENEKVLPKEPQPEQKPLIISEVQQVVIDHDTEDLPWFEDAQGNRKPEMYNFIGRHENIPCVLVMTIYGRLVPPYLVAGFIGMFPKYHEFPEVKQESQPKEELPINASTEPNISPLQEETFEQVIPQEPIHAQEPKKKSLFDGIFGKKEKATTETTTNADLAKRIIDAQSS